MSSLIKRTDKSLEYKGPFMSHLFIKCLVNVHVYVTRHE